jgi:hypothetical protein
MDVHPQGYTPASWCAVQILNWIEGKFGPKVAALPSIVSAIPARVHCFKRRERAR